jgi:hypothetical protein
VCTRQPGVELLDAGLRCWPGSADHGYRRYREGMGVMGELFPGKKLTDEGSEDSAGQSHRPRFDIDLDTGVARVPRADPPPADDGTTAGTDR